MNLWWQAVHVTLETLSRFSVGQLRYPGSLRGKHKVTLERIHRSPMDSGFMAIPGVKILRCRHCSYQYQVALHSQRVIAVLGLWAPILPR